MKTVLITGANGFVASPIAGALQLRGYKLVLLDRAFDVDRRLTWQSHSASLIETELSDFHHQLEVDAVIHAAAITAEPQELGISAEDYLQASLDANLHMLRWSRTNNIKRFIFISSAGVFSSAQQVTLSEKALPQSKGLYAVAKRATEDLMLTLNGQKDADFISVRLGNIYGESERPRTSRPRVSLFQRMLSDALENKLITVPNESPRDWTYAGDAAKLFVSLLEADAPQELYHFVSDETFTALELAQKIQRALPGVRLELSPEPTTQLRAPLKSERVSDLGFSAWTPLEKGLEQVIRAQPPIEVSA